MMPFRAAKRPKLLDVLTAPPLRSTGDSEDDGGKDSPVALAQPITAVSPAAKPASLLEYSEMELESDDELPLEVESILAASELPKTTVPATPPSATSMSSALTSSSSSEDADKRGSGPKGQPISSDPGTTAGAGASGAKPAVSTSMESSSYHVRWVLLSVCPMRS